MCLLFQGVKTEPVTTIVSRGCREEWLSRVNIPPDAAQTVKTCFLGPQDAKFPGLLGAACCALSPHLEHDLTKTEKKKERKEDGVCV